MPRKSRKPLSKKQKAEIWKSFWFHAIGAAVFIPFVVIAANVGVMADTHAALKSVILGIPNFLVWARFVTKIRKYQESTGIPYPSTYFALALCSFVIIVGPLLMFLFLLIRMSRVPTIDEPKDDTVGEWTTPSAARVQSSALQIPLQQQACAGAPRVGQPNVEPFVTLKQPFVTSESENPTIMKPDPVEQPSESPLLDDEPFYEEVAKEIESDTMKPGLWTKAFAEADGDDNQAKAIYIRLRVAQLISAKEAEMKELQRLEEERIKAEEHARIAAEQAKLIAEQEEAARQQANEMEQQMQEAIARQARLKANREEAKKLQRDYDKKMREGSNLAHEKLDSEEPDLVVPTKPRKKRNNPSQSDKLHPVIVLFIIIGIILCILAMRL